MGQQTGPPPGAGYNGPMTNPEAAPAPPPSALTVIGGGLAGVEAAWQAAERGLAVTLYEMRPVRQTPAHQSSDLAELVCSNSLGSTRPERAGGMLKEELRQLGSLILGWPRPTPCRRAARWRWTGSVSLAP